MNEKVNKLKDFLNMEEYLENDCYCPGDIYSSDVFFYNVFSADNECVYLGERKDEKLNFLALAACDDDYKSLQILILCRNNTADKIIDAVRFDATEANLTLIKEIISGEKDSGIFDEYKPGSTAKHLNEILAMADIIMVD